MSLGFILALIGLILTVVFWAMHSLPDPVLLLFALAFLAILLGGVGTPIPWPWGRRA